MIEVGTLVEKDGVKGVVIPDFWNMSACDEGVQVAWDGEEMIGGKFAAFTELKVIGPENAQGDLNKCVRAGGADACKYLVMHPVTGVTCKRHSELRVSLYFSEFKAKHIPVKMYPECQTEPFRGRE